MQCELPCCRIDCHGAVWLSGFISDAHLSSVLLFYEVALVLQSWTQVIRSSDFCILSHGDSGGPLQSPALFFALFSRITEEARGVAASWGKGDWLEQHGLFLSSPSLDVLRLSWCLREALILVNTTKNYHILNLDRVAYPLPREQPSLHYREIPG